MKQTCIFALLTAVLVYQAYYNYKANQEMGGKYQSLDRVLYSFVSLLPAVALGLYATRLSFSDKAHRGVYL